MPRTRELEYEKVFKGMVESDLNNLIDEAKYVIKKLKAQKEAEAQAARAEQLIKKIKIGMTATYSKGKGPIKGIIENPDGSYSVQIEMNGRRRKVALTKLNSVE